MKKVDISIITQEGYQTIHYDNVDYTSIECGKALHGDLEPDEMYLRLGWFEEDETATYDLKSIVTLLIY